MKSLKISGENVPLKYKNMDENDAGEYIPEKGEIILRKDLKEHEHDETLVHEMVHAVEHLSSLRHVRSITPDTWEVIAGELGRAIADNFILIPRK